MYDYLVKSHLRLILLTALAFGGLWGAGMYGLSFRFYKETTWAWTDSAIPFSLTRFIGLSLAAGLGFSLMFNLPLIAIKEISAYVKRKRA